MPDWLVKYFPHVITGVILALAIQGMARKRAVDSEDGFRKVLAFSRWVSGLGALLFLFFLVMVGFAVYGRTEGWEALGIVGAVFCLLGVFLFLYGTFNKVEIDGYKLVSHAFWREPVTLHWIEIAKVDFTATKQFRFQSRSGTRIHVDMLIGGLDRLLGEMARNLPVERYLDAVRAYWKASRAYHDSVGSILAVPPEDMVEVSGRLEGPSLEKFLFGTSSLVGGGLGKKEVQDILRQVKRLKKAGGIHFDLPVLFRGMPAHFFLYFYLSEEGKLGLALFAPPKLAEGARGELEKAGAADILLVHDEEEESEEE